MFGKLPRIGIGALLVGSMFGGPSLASAAQPTPRAGDSERLIVVARSDADYDHLRSEIQNAGGSIVKDMRGGGMLVATGASTLQSKILATGLASDVARDHIESLINPASAGDLQNSKSAHSRLSMDAATSQAAAAAMGHRPVLGDPAFFYPGLMWDIDRIEAPAAWQTTTGSPTINVGIADTGLDYTHAELASKVASVHDFTGEEDPPICKTVAGLGDADLAATSGGPADGDFNGHGTWNGGNIAAALDRQGVNGIAPNVKLVSLKVSQWCGSAYDSTIMDAFLWAGDHNLDVVNISIGGYLLTADPDQKQIWKMYNRVVRRVRSQGTLIVASAGNEHLRIDTDGSVVSHSAGLPCTPESTDTCDVFGEFEAPGGVPGVIMVSATNNVVAPSSRVCPPGSTGTPGDLDDLDAPVCKPTTDRHQAGGQGRPDQLAYYSNYGPRIDLAGPGGARKFNLPNFDRGGTPGFPYTRADFATAFEDFNITSNFAIVVPCFTFSGGGFPANQCYSSIQGTSMAAPHVAAVAALVLSEDPSLRNRPDRLERALKSSARHVSGNQTQVLSASDRSKADLTEQECPTGYCHLGEATISDDDAYGAGIVDARRAVNR